MTDRLTTMRRIRFLSIGLALALLAFASSGHAFAETDAERQARIDDYVRTAEIDPTRPGADDPRVHEGMAALKARDFERAVAIWHPLAEAGNAEAQFRMGLAYGIGTGVPIDGARSINWYERAWEQGYAAAALNIAITYDLGETVKRDYGLARRFYANSIELGETYAYRGLGLLIFGGRGGYQDKIEGLMWLLIGQNMGDKNSGLIAELRPFYTSADLRIATRRSEEWLKSHSSQ